VEVLALLFQFQNVEQGELMLELSSKWAPILLGQPESGMGYQIVSVLLCDGRCFDRVTVVGGTITEVKGESNIPFNEEEIAEIKVSHGN
jgi:hypothetical protein